MLVVPYQKNYHLDHRFYSNCISYVNELSGLRIILLAAEFNVLINSVCFSFKRYLILSAIMANFPWITFSASYP